jgi:hypothetical protein
MELASNPRGTTAADEFGALYQAWFAAIHGHDREWFERTLADDYRLQAFVGDDAGRPRRLELDKAEFIAFDMLIESCDIEALEVTAQVYGDVAISSMVARDAIVLPAAIPAAVQPVVDKIGFAGDLAHAVDGGMTALYASAWRREHGRWRCFNHQLVAVLGPAGTEPR